MLYVSLKMTRIIIRILATIIAVGGAAWYIKEPNFEPILTSLSGIIAVLGTYADKIKQQTSNLPPITQPERKDECNNFDDSIQFFMHRFTEAFPGVRGVVWFNKPQDSIKRLSTILAKPLSFPYTPIWWWRGANNDIKSFRHLMGRKIILGSKELIIDKIAAINLDQPYRMFVYVQTKPDKACGLYKHTRESRQRMIKNQGYAWEEMGYYNETYITLDELDDGVAEINGVSVKLDSQASNRTRFLSPYNMIIAPQSSPINNNQFDETLRDTMNKILLGESTVDDLAKELAKLPKLRQR